MSFRLSRYYSVGMGAGNLLATLLLFALSRINAIYGWPNWFVSFLGPAATVVFCVISVMWFLDALRPGYLRRCLRITVVESSYRPACRPGQAYRLPVLTRY